MSQCDYIKYKRVANELKNQAASMSPAQYTQYKEFTLENTIVNTKQTNNQLALSGRHPIFGMEKKVTNCPTFTICKNTNSRARHGRLFRNVMFNPKEDYDVSMNAYVKSPNECWACVGCAKCK